MERVLGDKPHRALSLDVAGRDGMLQLVHLLAQLRALGVPSSPHRWFAHRTLADSGLDRLLDDYRKAETPPPATWRVNPARAEPWR